MYRILRRILAFCGPKYAARIRAAYVFSFLKSIFTNIPIMASAFILRSLLANEATWITCCLTAGILCACLLLGSVFQNLSDRFQSSAGFLVFAEKRLAFAEHLRKLPMGYFSAGNIGRISSILSDDMVFIEENAMGIVAEVASSLFTQVILTIFVFTIHPMLGLIVLAVSILGMLLGVPMNRESMRNSQLRQQSIEDMTSSILEYIDGFAVNRSFGLTGKSAGELRRGFAIMRDADLQYEKQHAPWERRQMILYGLGSGIVLVASIILMEKGALSGASFISLLLFLFCLFTPVRSLQLLDHRMTIMDACLNRLEDVFAEKTLDLTITSKDTVTETRNEPEIMFRNVTFGYQNETVLHDVSFAGEKGQMIALTGESGSGKTTIANLLARFWDIEEGEILLRGKNIRELAMEDLMSQISMVFQKVYLFDDTIFNNIAMGRPGADENEVIEAARKARCHDFIMRLPYGYDTRVGEGGATLSGGEKQRISIARCILKDAPIIILDEATASIDADNEYYIEQAMSELCRDRTVLVIAHRLNTIRDADKILVLDQGRIVESGTHEELMELKGRYYKSYMLQVSMNEGWSAGHVTA